MWCIDQGNGEKFVGIRVVGIRYPLLRERHHTPQSLLVHDEAAMLLDLTW